jgi:hypothetical protein
MDGVVDAGMQRMPATQAAAVGGIDNGVDLQPRDVTLPEDGDGRRRKGRMAGLGDVPEGNNAALAQLRLQLAVLRLQELQGQRLRTPDVHQGA